MRTLLDTHGFEVRDKVIGVQKVRSECPVGDWVLARVEVKSRLRDGEISLGFGR